LRAELSQHTGAANPVGSFYFWNRTRVDIASSAFGLLQPTGQKTLAPYLDRDLWPFLAALPLGLVRDYKLHEDVIRIAYPHFAHIRYSHKHPERRRSLRKRAISMLAAIARERPSRASLSAAARLFRSLVIPSHARDVDWITSSWVYGDTLERVVAPRRA
jgi:hypothetical protein